MQMKWLGWCIIVVGIAGCGSVAGPSASDGGGAGEDAGGIDAAAAVDATVPDAALPPAPACASLRPAGWVQGVPTEFTDVQWVSPPTARWNPFPIGGGVGRIATDDGRYLAIRFTTPASAAEWSAPSRMFLWGESQVDGTVPAEYMYITISRCPGDFRIPPVNDPAPANDPTFAAGCTSFRRSEGFPTAGPASNIGYTIGGTSTPFTCALQVGQTYYINFIRAGVGDGAIGSPEQEKNPNTMWLSNCSQPDRTYCGVQMVVF